MPAFPVSAGESYGVPLCGYCSAALWQGWSNFSILCTMTKLLEEAVEELRALPEDEQNRAAQALLAFTRERADYTFGDEQIAGIHHAMGQADRGEFASDVATSEIFGRSLA